MRHWIHDARSGLFGTAHTAAHANRCTVFPAQVGQLPHNDHDALDGVFVFQALGCEVGSRFAWTFIGNRSRCVPTNPVGLGDTKATLSRPCFSRNTNRCALFFQLTFAGSLLVEDQFRFAQRGEAIAGDLRSVLLSERSLPLAGITEGLEEGFPSCGDHDVFTIVMMRETQQHHRALGQTVLLQSPSFGQGCGHDRLLHRKGRARERRRFNIRECFGLQFIHLFGRPRFGATGKTKLPFAGQRPGSFGCIGFTCCWFDDGAVKQVENGGEPFDGEVLEPWVMRWRKGRGKTS